MYEERTGVLDSVCTLHTCWISPSVYRCWSLKSLSIFVVAFHESSLLAWVVVQTEPGYLKVEPSC